LNARRPRRFRNWVNFRLTGGYHGRQRRGGGLQNGRRQVTESFVHYAAADRIVTLTLNRPETRNAIGAQQDCQDVIDALRRAEDDGGVSCIVLTGAGASFCAGGNLKGMQSRSGIGRLGTPEATRANYRRGVQRMIRALWDCEVPMVAAVNGHAIGLGLDLACICDVRLAADTAKFASSFI
jgi:2-(1,2-epoxy-1,2-dihydrophenyl)acetyl-CoA isomerase